MSEYWTTNNEAGSGTMWRTDTTEPHVRYRDIIHDPPPRQEDMVGATLPDDYLEAYDIWKNKLINGLSEDGVVLYDDFTLNFHTKNNLGELYDIVVKDMNGKTIISSKDDKVNEEVHNLLKGLLKD